MGVICLQSVLWQAQITTLKICKLVLSSLVVKECSVVLNMALVTTVHLRGWCEEQY